MLHIVTRPQCAENHPMFSRKPIVNSCRCDRTLAHLLHCGSLLAGVVVTLLGPLLPTLTARWHLDDAEAGWLFTAQFAGALTGSALSGLMMAHLGVFRLISWAYAITAVAVACLGVSSWGIGLLLVFSFGLALGLTGPTVSLLVAELNPERRAEALNTLSFAWALGAVVGPPMITLFASDGHLVRPLVGLAVFLSVLALLMARRSRSNSSFRPNRLEPNQKDALRLALRAGASPYALLTGALVFIYVGAETATSGWIASYAQRLHASSNGLETMTPSFFWTGLLIGRAAASRVLRYVSEATLVLISLFVAGAGLLVILAGSGLITISFGATLAGLGLGPIFPTTFALFTQRLGKQASQLSGLFFVVASLGGAFIPWLVGFTSASSGDLRLALCIPLFCVASMILLQIAVIRTLVPKPYVPEFGDPEIEGPTRTKEMAAEGGP
jgi:MFS transporter, FHS family, glucose/mannose:H+ symporter